MMKAKSIILSLLVLAATLGGKAANLSELYYQRASLFEQLPVDSTNIVMLGNSLTHYCEWHELLDNPKVINRGISGDIVEGVDLRLDGVLRGKPAKIFLLIGVNDVSHHLTADSIAAATEALVDRILTESPTTKLYLQSCLPINTSFNRYVNINGKEQVIRDLNALNKKMAEAKGVTWIDLYPYFCDEDGNLRTDYTNDGLHLLAPGYMVWRERIAPYVNE